MPPAPPAPVRRAALAVTGSVAAVALVVGLAPGTATASGSSAVWHAKVTYGNTDHIIDGDTEAVQVSGDASWETPPHIRNAGIQTMETGQCHAAQATASMTRQTAGKRVRLTTNNVAASSLGRPVRHVDAWNGTSWVDTQLAQLKAGHALPVPTLGGDSTRWKAYAVAAQQAAKARVNLWDSDFCGSGPAQATPLKVWVNWDGNFDEAKDPNQEWVRILNSSKTALSLKGWWVRTGGQDEYRFPSTATVPAGGTTTLYVGKGTNTATKFYWGSTKAKFANTNGSTTPGSGAYLFDPQGDLRAWSMYPCLYACSDPLAGKVKMTVRADAPGVDAANLNGEYATFTPAGNYMVDLSYKVASAFGHTYEFPRGSTVRPGEYLVLRIGKGTGTRLARYWGNTGPVLANGGGTVVLRNPENVRIACKAWGNGRC